MSVKKFVAKSLSEAIEIARVNLGNDIEIIDTKYVRKPGISGIMSKKNVEITVTKKENEDYLRKEINTLRSIISNLENPKSNNDLEKICKKLEALDVKPEIIEEVKNTLPTMKNDEMSNNLVEYLKSNIETSDIADLNSRIVLVGPPGVGKTTTIAKLAANLVFKQNKTVGVITIDTYRIGAVEQLKIYSDIIDVKFKAVLTSEEMKDALIEMEKCDVVLIDTTGRSCKNSMQISELNNYIKSTGSDNIHLVLNITTKEKDLEAIIDSYRNINFEHIIFTKLDETEYYGTILNVSKYAQKPISYLTTGQNVPDDILSPSKNQLIRILLGVEKI